MQRCLGCMQEFEEEMNICPHCGYTVGTETTSKNHLVPGTVLHNRFTLGKVLGQGGFGITYIAWDSHLNRPVAIKEYMPSIFASRIFGETEVFCYNEDSEQHFSRGKEKIVRESLTIASLNDVDGVVRVFDYLEENKTAYIVMELLRGKTVRDVLEEKGSFSLQEAAAIMQPVLQTLSAMHAKGVIHRDVAPDNIFICDDARVKLLDFGAARMHSSDLDQKTVSVILKYGYAPREQYATRSEQGPFTDVYSASATLYKLLTGETPPESIGRSGRDREDFRALLALDLPRRVKDAVIRGMHLDPARRTQSAAQLLAVLEPYLPQEYDPVTVEDKPPQEPETVSLSKPSTPEHDSEHIEKEPPRTMQKIIRALSTAAIITVVAIGAILAVHRMQITQASEIDLLAEEKETETVSVGSFANFFLSETATELATETTYATTKPETTIKAAKTASTTKAASTTATAAEQQDTIPQINITASVPVGTFPKYNDPAAGVSIHLPSYMQSEKTAFERFLTRTNDDPDYMASGTENEFEYDLLYDSERLDYSDSNNSLQNPSEELWKEKVTEEGYTNYRDGILDMFEIEEGLKAVNVSKCNKSGRFLYVCDYIETMDNGGNIYYSFFVGIYNSTSYICAAVSNNEDYAALHSLAYSCMQFR